MNEEIMMLKFGGYEPLPPSIIDEMQGRIHYHFVIGKRYVVYEDTIIKMEEGTMIYRMNSTQLLCGGKLYDIGKIYG